MGGWHTLGIRVLVVTIPLTASCAPTEHHSCFNRKIRTSQRPTGTVVVACSWGRWQSNFFFWQEDDRNPGRRKGLFGPDLRFCPKSEG